MTSIFEVELDGRYKGDIKVADQQMVNNWLGLFSKHEEYGLQGPGALGWNGEVLVRDDW